MANFNVTQFSQNKTLNSEVWTVGDKILDNLEMSRNAYKNAHEKSVVLPGVIGTGRFEMNGLI